MNKIIFDYIKIIIGTFIVAISVNIFFIPHNLSSGGATGVGIMLKYLFEIPLGLTIMIVNIPLFLISLKNLGWKFCVRSIIGTGFLSLFIELTSQFSKYDTIIKDIDIITASIFGGIILGIGLSLVFKGNGSTGGSDLLAQIIYKYRKGIGMGQIILIIDSLVIISTIFVFKSINSGLYSIILIYLSKKTIDIMFDGVNYTKVINIITREGEKIADDILEKIERGVTSYDCIR